jgi:hypothetical protein
LPGGARRKSERFRIDKQIESVGLAPEVSGVLRGEWRATTALRKQANFCIQGFSLRLETW